MCVLKTIWFSNIDVCVLQNTRHHLNETTQRKKWVIKVVVRRNVPYLRTLSELYEY